MNGWERADRESGESASAAPSSDWYHRGYLPHFDSSHHLQHVTFHLADSLPREVVDRLETELRRLPQKQQDVERRKRIEAWIDAGHGSCLLRQPSNALLVQSTLLNFDGERYQIIAWVIMPNHVHVLFEPLAGYCVSDIVASWKKFTARRLTGDTPGNATLPSGENDTVANREIGVPGKKPPIWHREYWDRYIRNERHFTAAVEYIHNNPVKAGLVSRAEEWPWSSAHPGHATLPSGETHKDIKG
jgi:REP element-mobilizing transposase RayT